MDCIKFDVYGLYQTTAGEIQTTGTNVINFGYNVSKVDTATGCIGYGTYDANTLCIVGGATSGERKISMWDWVKMLMVEFQQQEI
jgi:hypothetical protein